MRLESFSSNMVFLSYSRSYGVGSPDDSEAPVRRARRRCRSSTMPRSILQIIHHLMCEDRVRDTRVSLSLYSEVVLTTRVPCVSCVSTEVRGAYFHFRAICMVWFHIESTGVMSGNGPRLGGLLCSRPLSYLQACIQTLSPMRRMPCRSQLPPLPTSLPRPVPSVRCLKSNAVYPSHS